MRTGSKLRKRVWQRILAALLWVAAGSQIILPAHAAFVRPGELAKDFTLQKRKTGEIVSLSDFAGKVIFLDLFAYW